MSATTAKTTPDRTLKGGATIGASTYVKPQEMTWEATQFPGISIKVLY